ncbi:MAG: hypothetical protein CLLPBCKN_006744 [Chroococcidiopsis cubana SAG 39.79]|uniref:Sigma-70 family RNA polymerase sigma factor n=1 Tax=Chroococcidiopsis cubana SAG 39.79 TaxID=388085 RepID=A0AB37UDW1_9CYAN|nr:sigma-70 family RNA polymerase sigma factor [Chroococcidiopsis cubana]MDZ4877309.1 hypothetical protein [Chroococcidiopsis cubana SAG 39.79]PSB62429.1 hypothetical protein C7B79_18065 [Chroococcidiopsis cubana CCALA 043]RUT05879.1 hypothetical protein DSM107010_54090 [Chroococcidiopsis cubana SAG 39.79]
MDLNERLKQLVLTAQQHPPKTPERQKALDWLFQAILSSGKLYYPYQGKFVYHYEEIKQEAVQNLFLCLCEKIDQYDPERAEVITWCSFLLRERCFKLAISQVIGRKDIQIMCLDDLERQASSERDKQKLLERCREASSEQFPSLAEEIESYIESDAEFRETYIKKHPEANFAALVKLYLEKKTWQEISEIFGISISTLGSFYQRSLKKFAPKIRKYLESI